ncbi:amidohydrolase family protein [Caballeronia mineralivorans]|uniref:Sox C-terminal domain-containing protein n=1 Tax=Caballeronia mineralivorans PML1(12) TaxID=908627 RepID=A0A0J1G4R6_9BURK|nr:amidohydrolase family protein [Caballeronia mineralivorans]KLU27173.1 hypothetical protein EOS_05640 [Caballeronia mineralivorans PML1(12)]
MHRLTPPPDLNTSTPSLKLPAGSVDSHLHMFGPVDRYPFAENAPYVSGNATAEMYFRMQDTLGLARAVLVSGGGYGETYEHLADTLAAYPDRLRGVVRLPASVTDGELAKLNALGVRGARFFSRNINELAPALIDRLTSLGWNIQFYPQPDGLIEHADRLIATHATVVLDHFAHNPASAGVNSAANRKLFELLDTGRFWVKISGPMRITMEEPPYPSVVPIARALVKHAPERLVWGSDWPHTNMWDRTMPNDAVLVDTLAQWIDDDATLKRIMVENPSVLYGFP